MSDDEKQMAWLMYKKGWSAGFLIGRCAITEAVEYAIFEHEYNKARVERVEKEMFGEDY